MKNVTGYDMTKLFVGSFGVLGVITEVTFRLLPRYDTQAVVVLPLSSLEEAKASVASVLTSYLQPLALEVVSADALPPDFASSSCQASARAPAPAAPATARRAGRPRPAHLLLAGFAGHRAAVDRSIGEVTDANPAAVPQVLRDEDAEALYEHLADDGGSRRRAGGADGGGAAQLGLRASVPISRALDVVLAAQDYAAANGLALGYRAGAARGRVDLLFAPQERVAPQEPAPGTLADAFRRLPHADAGRSRGAWAARSSSPGEPACCRPATTPGETWGRRWRS